MYNNLAYIYLFKLCVYKGPMYTAAFGAKFKSLEGWFAALVLPIPLMKWNIYDVLWGAARCW